MPNEEKFLKGFAPRDGQRTDEANPWLVQLDQWLKQVRDAVRHLEAIQHGGEGPYLHPPTFWRPPGHEGHPDDPPPVPKFPPE